MNKIWQEISDFLKEKLSGPGFQTFISSTRLLSFDKNVLMIEVSNSFSKEWFHEKCETLIGDFLDDKGFENVLFEYVVRIPENSDNQLSIFSKPTVNQNAPPSPFNPKYTFENFVVGHNNRFAYAASEAVSSSPAKAYNPLFIYGSVGLGKTHLLHAIGTRIHGQYPHLKIQLVSSEKFTNELINSIKDKRMEAFRARYRYLDVLLVDDIQFLAGKEQTQEEFFHTFNDLHGNNKQIILTSDRPPKEIPTLEDRLRTRFEWGLIADIQPPEFETRMAILRKKTELNQLPVSDEIIHYIATQIPSNVREMEGALTRIIAYASLLDTDITLSIASNVIKDMVGVSREKPLTIQFIQRKVCDYFNISTTDMCAKTRIKEVAYARQIAMYLARELTNVTLPKIGETFGNRDHSTVMHACDKIKGMIKEDFDTRNIIQVLISNIKNDE